MENKGKQKYNPRDDMSLDQAILQWIVDDYDIPDEKSRKIVGESGKKSKLITSQSRRTRLGRCTIYRWSILQQWIWRYKGE